MYNIGQKCKKCSRITGHNFPVDKNQIREAVDVNYTDPKLARDKVCITLDLSIKYGQKENVKITTWGSLFMYKTPYGVKLSPRIFQVTIDKIVQGT